MFNFFKSPEKQKSVYQLKIFSNIDKKSMPISPSFLNTAFEMSATDDERKLMDKLFLNKIRPEVASIFIATDHIQQVGQIKREFNPVLSVILLLYLSNAVAIKIPDLSYTNDEVRNAAKAVKMKYGDIVASMFENEKSNSWQYETFHQWYDVYLSELKRIDSDSLVEGLHYVELMDDEPLRQAFKDQQCPKKIADDFVKYSSSSK